MKHNGSVFNRAKNKNKNKKKKQKKKKEFCAGYLKEYSHQLSLKSDE